MTVPNQILKPVRAPWALSVSMAILKLCHVEEEWTCCVDSWGHEIPNDEEYQNPVRIRISFRNGCASRLTPITDRYWFEALGRVEGDIPSDRDDFRVKWRADGICPDPQMYEIINSAWVASFAGKLQPVRHWIICGCESYVEVLAEDWTWEKLPRASD